MDLSSWYVDDYFPPPDMVFLYTDFYIINSLDGWLSWS